MNHSNVLIIKEGVLQLKGFKGLKSKVTFCFFPAGVVIINGDAEEKPFRFQAEVDEYGYLKNVDILEHLEEVLKICWKSLIYSMRKMSAS